jgi:hypothetical protein
MAKQNGQTKSPTFGATSGVSSGSIKRSTVCALHNLTMHNKSRIER